MRRAGVALALFLALTACGGIPAFLTGGGTKVAANVQAGESNIQGVGETVVNNQKIVRPTARKIVQNSDTGSAKVEKIERVEKVVGQEGWGFWPVMGALLFPSPLGLFWWPLLRRWRGRFKGH